MVLGHIEKLRLKNSVTAFVPAAKIAAASGSTTAPTYAQMLVESPPKAASTKKCGLCSGMHDVRRCNTMAKMDANAKYNHFKDKNLCTRCLTDHVKVGNSSGVGPACSAPLPTCAVCHRHGHWDIFHLQTAPQPKPRLSRMNNNNNGGNYNNNNNNNNGNNNNGNNNNNNNGSNYNNNSGNNNNNNGNNNNNNNNGNNNNNNNGNNNSSGNNNNSNNNNGENNNNNNNGSVPPLMPANPTVSA